jgi:hypothetical protein
MPKKINKTVDEKFLIFVYFKMPTRMQDVESMVQISLTGVYVFVCVREGRLYVNLARWRSHYLAVSMFLQIVQLY